MNYHFPNKMKLFESVDIRPAARLLGEMSQRMINFHLYSNSFLGELEYSLDLHLEKGLYTMKHLTLAAVVSFILILF